MTQNKSFKKLAVLLKKPYFSSKEAKHLGISTSLLCYYVKTGKLRRIGKGVYQSSDFQSITNSLWEDLIEVVYSVPQGVICLISALAIYKLTEEISREYWVAIPHTTSAKAGSQVKILRFRNMELGKTSLRMNETNIPIFNRERCIIDAFRHLSLETALKALKMALQLPKAEKIDLVKLQEYAKKLRVNITPYLMAMTI